MVALNFDEKSFILLDKKYFCGMRNTAGYHLGLNLPLQLMHPHHGSFLSVIRWWEIIKPQRASFSLPCRMEKVEFQAMLFVQH